MAVTRDYIRRKNSCSMEHFHVKEKRRASEFLHVLLQAAYLHVLSMARLMTDQSNGLFKIYVWILLLIFSN